MSPVGPAELAPATKRVPTLLFVNLQTLKFCHIRRAFEPISKCFYTNPPVYLLDEVLEPRSRAYAPDTAVRLTNKQDP